MKRLSIVCALWFFALFAAAMSIASGPVGDRWLVAVYVTTFGVGLGAMFVTATTVPPHPMWDEADEREEVSA